MNFYASYVQFTDGTHECYIGLCENGLVVKRYATEKFGKDVLMTHSTIIAPDVDEITGDMEMNAKIWYGIHERMGGMNV